MESGSRRESVLVISDVHSGRGFSEGCGGGSVPGKRVGTDSRAGACHLLPKGLLRGG